MLLCSFFIEVEETSAINSKFFPPTAELLPNDLRTENSGPMFEEGASMPQWAESVKIQGYHAHIYYDHGSRETAASLREAIEKNFQVVMGRWRDEPVGPHPQAMYQVKFEPPEFARIVPWLMLNRSGLNVLVHPETDNAYLDHAENALWLGQKLALRLDVLRNIQNS